MGYDDIETGFGQTAQLYPGIGAEENELRWGFIRKVYGILSVQLVLTTIVASFVVLIPAVTAFFLNTPGLLIFCAVLPMICKFCCYHSLPFLFCPKISLTVDQYINFELMLLSLLLTHCLSVSLYLV